MLEVKASKEDLRVRFSYFMVNLAGEGEFPIADFDLICSQNLSHNSETKSMALSALKYVVLGSNIYFFDENIDHLEFVREISGLGKSTEEDDTYILEKELKMVGHVSVIFQMTGVNSYQTRQRRINAVSGNFLFNLEDQRNFFDEGIGSKLSKYFLRSGTDK